MSVNKEKSTMDTPNYIQRNNTAWYKRAIVYICSFGLLYSSIAPSVAAVLVDSYIQDQLNSYATFELANSSQYQFQSPSYIEASTPLALDLESFHELLKTNYQHALDKPAYIPIGVGDITTIIPVYDKPKLVGTPLVQSRYIRAQIHALLGRNLIDVENPAYTTEAAQLNTLYSNALNYINSVPGTVYGDKLELDQENTGLIYDMVWPELRQINGEEVVVPIVYLSNGTIANRRVDSNVTELLSNVSLDALTIDEVNIQFGRDTFLSVANDLLNNQGSISGTGELEIVAGGGLTNLSGVIQSTGDLRIGAHSVTNRTIVHRYDEYNNRLREQGARYGEIAAINSTDGSVTVRSYSDIVFQGAQAVAGGAITLAADGNIYLGSQQIQSSASGYQHGDYTSSSVSFLQSGLSASDTIQLIANGEIVIDAAEIVSDEGHIEILAGLGITVEDDLQQFRSYREGKFGDTEVTESVYKTVAIRALLDAGKGVRLHSEFGDITLKASDISTTQGTSVNAANGGVNLLMTVENDHYSYSSIKESLFTIKTTSRGHDIETGVPNTIIGGLVVESANGITVEYEGDRSLSLDEQVAELAKFEGLEWMADVRANSPDADWTAIELKYETWKESNTSLSPAFAAVIAIVLAVVTAGAGAAAAGAILSTSAAAATSTVVGAAIAAGTTALITQAVMIGINTELNDGDIDDAMDQLASSDTLKSIAIAMVTAGAIQAVDASFFNVTGDSVNADSFLIDPSSATQVTTSTGQVTTQYALSLSGQAVQAVTHAAVQSGVQSVILGADFEDSFVQSLAQTAVNSLGEDLTQRIGLAAKGDPLLGIAPDIGAATQYIAHAAVGCLTGGLTSRLDDGDTDLGCVSGAGGAVIGEFIGQQYEESLESDLEAWIDDQVSGDVIPTRDEIFQQGLAFKQRGVDMARLGGALTAFVTGGDVDIAAASSANVAENNALFTTIAIISALAYTSYVSYQEGGLLEGLQSIGRGDDPLSQAMGDVTEAGVELLAAQFPEAAEDTAQILNAVGDKISAGVKVVLETNTGQQVTRYWNEIPEDKRNALVGAGKVVSFVVPASVITKLRTVSNLEVEPGDWVKDSGHSNWDRVPDSDREFLNDHSVGAAEWGLIPSATRLENGTELDVHLDYERREHILYGDSNARGGHSTNSGDVVIDGDVEVSANGVRYAQVEINGVLKSNNGGYSTLFPESWTDADIMREFSDGLSNGSVRGNGGYVTTTPSGVRIQYYLKGDKIRTFYPLFE